MSARLRAVRTSVEVALVERAHRRDDRDHPAVSPQILGTGAHDGGGPDDLEGGRVNVTPRSLAGPTMET